MYIYLYCNREEITVPLSIAKCYHHSKVLLCGYRYCYRHCLYRYCTGTVAALYYMGTGTMLYRYVCMATGNTVYGYQYCLLLPTGHMYCNRELYALAARELYGQQLGHQQVQRARLHIGMRSMRKRAHDALPILLCTCTHYVHVLSTGNEKYVLVHVGAPTAVHTCTSCTGRLEYVHVLHVVVRAQLHIGRLLCAP